MLQSLRAKVIAAMGLLIALVLVIAAIGVNSIHSLDRSVDRELNLLLAGTELEQWSRDQRHQRDPGGRAVPGAAGRDAEGANSSPPAIRPTPSSGATGTWAS